MTHGYTQEQIEDMMSHFTEWELELLERIALRRKEEQLELQEYYDTMSYDILTGK